MPTTTYTSNGTFHVTGSSLAVTMSCVGAGGNGSTVGNGGSGGAYAQSYRTLYTGSYAVYVGQATATDGGDSYILSGSNNVVIIRAPGGKQDGSIDHQSALLTGSKYAYYGGHGSPDFLGYSSYNGSGGGQAGSINGNGQSGQNAFFSTVSSPASGGYAYDGTGAGGDGAYYRAGSTTNGVIPATAGTAPGGGGGGSYDYGISSAGAGAAGIVTIAF
jgi:hypothetical protein